MWMWRPYWNYTYNGMNGFSLNVPMPNLRGPSNAIDNQTASLRALRDGDFAIYATAGINDERGTVPAEFIKMSLKKGEEGTMVWNKTLTPPFSIPTAIGAMVDPTAAALGVSARGVLLTGVYPDDDIILYRQEMTQELWAYSLTNGNLLWQVNNLKDQFNFYGMTITYIMQAHKIYITGYGGIVRAYDIKNGTEVWNYTAGGIGYESPYGNYPLSVGKIADGKIYLYSSEHSPTMPLWRGSSLRALDWETGQEVFKVAHWGTSFALGDGILVGLDLYDNRIYAYGKGPSSTTVAASPSINGKDVVITGTVIDESSGTKQRFDIAPAIGVLGTEQAGRFPNGVPAISDQDQSAWMEYVYKQQEGARTPNAKGVDVTLTAIDPNGNTQNIGTATSDQSGAYSIMWTPPVAGKYTIVATFAGSKAYYPSYAESAFGVSEVTQTPAPPAPQAAPDNTVTIVGTGIAMIAAVAIVGLLLLRKRP
jgi:hypothetical protein